MHRWNQKILPLWVPFLVALGSIPGAFAQDANLILEKVGVPLITDVGQVVTYSLEINNEGPDAAVDVLVMDELAAGTVFLSATANICQESQGTVLCELQTMEPETSRQLTITVVIQAVGNLKNTATVTSDTQDPEPANNSSSFVVISAGSGTAGASSGSGCRMGTRGSPGMPAGGALLPLLAGICLLAAGRRVLR